MKGLTHFMTGAAIASFFPKAVEMAASPRVASVDIAQASFILVLGGLYGIMPDTLDFKAGQFFSKPDYDIDCDPIKPDPQKMALQIGRAMEKAFSMDKYIKVQLYPMQVGANSWRQYVVKFDNKTNEIVVTINEIVSTSQVPYLGTEPKENRIGRYKIKTGKILETHGRPSVVDIMSGPQFGFKKSGDSIYVEFLPWHRTWSHSYLLGLFLTIPVFLITYFLGYPLWWMYGLIAFLGFFGHITEDLTGHMGGSLFWPFQKSRTNGLCLFKASHPGINFSIDYGSVIVILWNIDRFTTQIIPLPWYLYFTYFLIIPLAVYFAFFYGFRSKQTKKLGEISAEKAEENARYDELSFEAEGVGE